MSLNRERDKRLYSRFLFTGASIECERPGLFTFTTRKLSVIVSNLSAGGLGLFCLGRLRKGETVRGVLTIPEADLQIKFSGRVRWASVEPAGTRFGLNFGRVSRKNLVKIEAIRKLITSSRYRRTRGMVRA